VARVLLDTGSPSSVDGAVCGDVFPVREYFIDTTNPRLQRYKPDWSIDYSKVVTLLYFVIVECSTILQAEYIRSIGLIRLLCLQSPRTTATKMVPFDFQNMILDLVLKYLI
jgi:hypothetical protein